MWQKWRWADFAPLGLDQIVPLYRDVQQSLATLRERA